MAHPYTTRVRVQKQARSKERVADLLDHDDDGQEDTIAAEAVIAEAIDSACELIDARLGKKYAVPFAGIADATPTPALITRIANFLALWECYSAVDPDSTDAKAYFARADGLLTGILDGTFYLNATLRGADSASSRRRVSWSGGGTIVAGRIEDSTVTTSDGIALDDQTPKSRGI